MSYYQSGQLQQIPDPFSQFLTFIQTREAIERSAARRYRKELQKIPSAVFTAIKLDTNIYDPGGHFNAAGEYLVPSKGVYLVTAQVEAVMTEAKKLLICSIFRNGGEDLRGGRIATVEAGEYSVLVSGMSEWEAGDKIILAAFQTCVGEISLGAENTAKNYMSIIRVA